jgi:hypothetical protein
MPLLFLASTILPNNLPPPAAANLWEAFPVWAHRDIVIIFAKNSANTSFITQFINVFCTPILYRDGHKTKKNINRWAARKKINRELIGECTHLHLIIDKLLQDAGSRVEYGLAFPATCNLYPATAIKN